MSVCEKVAHGVCVYNVRKSLHAIIHTLQTLSFTPPSLHSQNIQQRGAALCHTFTHSCTSTGTQTAHAQTHR